MKNSLVTFFASIMALFAVTACEGTGTGADTDPDRLVVGFAAIEMGSDWRKAQVASMQNEADRRGMELRLSDAEGSQDFQLTALRRFIAQQVDVIVLAPVVEAGWDIVLEDARRAGIPVILVDRTVNVEDPGLYVSAVGSDFHEEGRLAARWIAGNVEGVARVLEIRGSAGASATTGRREGFAEMVEELDELELAHSDAGNFSGEEAANIAQTYLTANGADSVDVIYAHNDGMAVAVANALPEAGFTPGEDVLIVGVDGSRVALQAIVDGHLAATVESNPVVGPQLFEVIDAVLAGEEVERRIIVDTSVFDSSNAAEAIPGRMY